MDINKIEAITNAATKGPWRTGHYDRYFQKVPVPLFSNRDDSFQYSPLAHCENGRDAEFIVCAREAMPVLINEVKRLTAENEWIPISSGRLPADGQQCMCLIDSYIKLLVFHTEYNDAEFEFEDNINRFWDGDIDGSWPVSGITHWMKKPVLPKKEEGVV